ncbi:effector-associated domain EAD1-containing protein [Calothrix sp. PCC 6303]|uniref:effector-associated domain EAD1-containing protein n=1 Tax=Calothrix sp. PCC 6303 TaxID=1170562 RepID=UPI0002A03C55|nr:effector-associated domain EAD1-containing protein [Calothrix sp. PCC 6303]AFZ01311.1 hypothetical protein Cal6303_2295 [Calothrix sp. PCC 6303]
MLKLDSSIIQELVEILTPYMINDRDRHSLLIAALGNNATVLQQITWSGAVATFIPDMAYKLVSYGEIAPGKQALWVLLDYVRSQRVGLDVQQRIDKLLDRLTVSHPPDPQPVIKNLQFLIKNKILQEFATTCNNQENADMLLDTIDFPGHLRPMFPQTGTALGYWQSICRQIQNGVLPGGNDLQLLVDAAAEIFPANSIFQQYRS